MTKYNYNLNYFFEEKDISCYLLGAFMTDGCIVANGPSKSSYSCVLSSKDEDWLKIITSYICSDMKIMQGNQVKVININSKQLGKWFISKGCVPRKSLLLQFPLITEKYVPDFLRGCWDGDGCITKYFNKKSHKIIYSSYLCSASLDFLIQIKNKLQNNNIKSSICKINKTPCKIKGRDVVPKNPHYRLNLGSKATYKLMLLLYYPDHQISLPRKYNLSQEIINYYKNLKQED